MNKMLLSIVIPLMDAEKTWKGIVQKKIYGPMWEKVLADMLYYFIVLV